MNQPGRHRQRPVNRVLEDQAHAAVLGVVPRRAGDGTDVRDEPIGEPFEFR